MNVLNFIKNASNNDFFLQHPVVGFTGTAYPFLFFSLLADKIKGFTHGGYRNIDLAQYDIEQLKGLVSMPFLGSSLVYWCGPVDLLDAKKKKDFLSLIKTYEGPHSLWFFSEKDEVATHKKLDLIALPSTLDQQAFTVLYTYFFPHVKAENISLGSAFFKQHDAIQLDRACLLMHYCSIMSRAQVTVFTDEWLDKILVPEKSLFSLSTYLFAKKATAFFTLWREISQDYPAQFWLSYWSDQLFRAACFVNFAQAQKFIPAKKIAYRLPFTFVKKDWQKYTAAQLADAHHFLCTLDFTIKNGGSEVWLDLFYQRFFKI